MKTYFMTTPKDQVLAYIAGIIDGEGSISIRQRKDRDNFTPWLRVQMCETEAVTLCHEVFGGSLTPVIYAEDRNARDGICWLVASKKCRVALEQVLPYLRVKKRQALCAIEVQVINEQIKAQHLVERALRFRTKAVDRSLYGKYATNPEFLTRSGELHQICRSLNKRGKQNFAHTVKEVA